MRRNRIVRFARMDFILFLWGVVLETARSVHCFVISANQKIPVLLASKEHNSLMENASYLVSISFNG